MVRRYKATRRTRFHIARSFAKTTKGGTGRIKNRPAYKRKK